MPKRKASARSPRPATKAKSASRKVAPKKAKSPSKAVKSSLDGFVRISESTLRKVYR